MNKIIYKTSIFISSCIIVRYQSENIYLNHCEKFSIYDDRKYENYKYEYNNNINSYEKLSNKISKIKTNCVKSYNINEIKKGKEYGLLNNDDINIGLKYIENEGDINKINEYIKLLINK